MKVPSFKLAATDYRVMPWKNGGGSTLELYRTGTSGDSADLRVSMAAVEANGPFSSFPEHVRTIIQLTGAPMTLSHAEGPGTTLSLLQPYQFDGAWTTSCQITTPCQDFNIFAAKGRLAATVAVIKAGKQLASPLGTDGTGSFLYQLAGAARLEGSDGRRLDLRTHEAFVVSEASSELWAAQLLETTAPSCLVYVSFTSL